MSVDVKALLAIHGLVNDAHATDDASRGDRSREASNELTPAAAPKATETAAATIATPCVEGVGTDLCGRPHDEAALVASPGSEAAPSEAARLFAEVVTALPTSTAEELRILLSQNLALPPAAERRQSRLGLLVELVSDGTGRVPTVSTYADERQRRRADNEAWPDASTLSRAYGGWTAAVAAAMELTGSPTSRSNPNWSRPCTADYTRAEVLEAISRCQDAVGYEPTLGELQEYGKLARRHARAAGQPDPRIPVRAVVRGHFGTWDAALKATRRWRAARDRAGAGAADI